MDWLYIFIAGIFECVWAIGLKYTAGFTRFWPSLVTISAMLASLYLLSLGMRTIPVGTAYTVWTGIGAVCVAVIGMFFLGDPKETARIICILLIIFGVIGLKIFS